MSGIGTTTLRYWDDIGLFSPTKRDPVNNYRCYSPDQVVAANFITVMSSLNIPLKAIAQAEKERNPTSIVEMIERQEKVLDKEMSRLRDCYSVIHTRRELIKYGMRIDESKIFVETKKDVEIILGPPIEFIEGESLYKPFMDFCGQAQNLRINMNFPMGGYHENLESFLRTPGKPQRFFTIDPAGNSKREAGKYLVGFTRGHYGEFGDLPKRIEAYKEENDLVCAGPVYMIYLFDEVCYKDPTQYLLQVCIALR